MLASAALHGRMWQAYFIGKVCPILCPSGPFLGVLTAMNAVIHSLFWKFLGSPHRGRYILAKEGNSILLCSLTLPLRYAKCSTGPRAEVLAYKFDLCSRNAEIRPILGAPGQKQIYALKQGAFKRNGSPFLS